MFVASITHAPTDDFRCLVFTSESKRSKKASAQRSQRLKVKEKPRVTEVHVGVPEDREWVFDVDLNRAVVVQESLTFAQKTAHASRRHALEQYATSNVYFKGFFAVFGVFTR
jgi:hypothetical protein